LADRIYLDHAATTPVMPAARDAVARGMAAWANASSPHAEGRRARAMLEEARGRIAAALGWTGTVILTSGASEAIALAVRTARVARVVPSPFEHDAVLRVVRGRRDGDGPVMRAVQTVNSETGMILPPPAGDDPWLADCAQSAGKLSLPDADMCVVSGHKLGGPPGIGALLVRDLALLEAGGGQEQGYRGGTENLPGALGLAAALEQPHDWLDDAARLRALLDAAVLDGGGAIVGPPHGGERLATIAAYRMPGVTAAAQLIRFDMAGFAVSAGSACSSGTLKTSPVLAALGLDDRTAGEVIRVSFGWTTTHDDVARFAEAWGGIAAGAGARAA
jgi:cysteine desulfurase